jgi:hypothetical protein
LKNGDGLAVKNNNRIFFDIIIENLKFFGSVFGGFERCNANFSTKFLIFDREIETKST